jgi:hypothetical protein
MTAPQGPMNRREGAPSGVTYSQITANEDPGTGTKRPTFETPPDMRAQLLVEGTFKDREMDIDQPRNRSLRMHQSHGCQGNASHRHHKPQNMWLAHHALKNRNNTCEIMLGRQVFRALAL